MHQWHHLMYVDQKAFFLGGGGDLEIIFLGLLKVILL